MKKLLSGPLLIFVLSSCMTGAPVLPELPAFVPLQTVFDPSEVAFINELGSNTIRGSAFIRQQGGGVVSCAGNEVYLVPRGAHSIERMDIVYGETSSPGFRLAIADRKMPEPPVDAYRSYQRETNCDIDGKFEFQNVAPGAYFVMTHVTWTVRYSTQGGALMVPVTFAGSDELKNVVLTL